MNSTVRAPFRGPRYASTVVPPVPGAAAYGPQHGSPYGPAAPFGTPAPARVEATAQHKARAKAQGKAAARAVAEYESFATSLASLRRQARRGTAGPDFAARELELLHHLWQRKDVAAPALTYAAQATGLLRPLPPPPFSAPAPYPGYGTGYSTGYNPYLLPPH